MSVRVSARITARPQWRPRFLSAGHPQIWKVGYTSDNED